MVEFIVKIHVQDFIAGAGYWSWDRNIYTGIHCGIYLCIKEYLSICFRGNTHQSITKRKLNGNDLRCGRVRRRLRFRFRRRNGTGIGTKTDLEIDLCTFTYLSFGGGILFNDRTGRNCGVIRVTNITDLKMVEGDLAFSLLLRKTNQCRHIKFQGLRAEADNHLHRVTGRKNSIFQRSIADYMVIRHNNIVFILRFYRT